MSLYSLSGCQFLIRSAPSRLRIERRGSAEMRTDQPPHLVMTSAGAHQPFARPNCRTAACSNIASLGWQHINLTGDYLWGVDTAIGPTGSNPWVTSPDDDA